MPGSRNQFKLIALSLALSFLAMGCATQPTSVTAKEDDGFRESSSDIHNRAPSSMSPPTEKVGTPNIDPTYLRTQADYHFALADTYALEGNSPRAIEEFKLTLLYDPQSSAVRLRLAAEDVKSGQVTEAIEQAKLAIQYQPKSEDAHLLLGGLYSALRTYDDAIAEYNKVLEINHDNSEATMLIGAVYAEQKKYPEAIKYFEKVATQASYKSRYLAYYYIGRIEMESSKPGSASKAEASFKKSLAARPDFPDAVLALGQVYETRKEEKAALHLYNVYQDEHGPDAGVAEALSRIYMAEKEYDKAYRQFEILEASDADNLNIKVKMAFILIEQKKYDVAISKMEDILGRAPYSDKIRFYLGAVYEEIKDYKGAVATFVKVPVGSSYYAESIVHAAYLYKLLGDYPKAIETVQSGIKNKDDYPQFYVLYASFLDDTKDYAKAIDMLEKATAKFPTQAQLQFFLGSMQDKVGNTVATIESMKKVLAIDANHIQALNYLAYTYADHDRNLPDAEAMARHALELQPSDGYIMDTLGWVLFKRGETSEAVKVLETAFKIQSQESIIAEHLGDAYYKYQLPEKAKKMYIRAVEVENNAEVVRKLRAKIVSIEHQQQNFGSLPAAASGRQPASADSVGSNPIGSNPISSDK